MNRTLIEKLQKEHPGVELVMASKYIDCEDFPAYYDAGIKDFGESRVEAFLEKRPNIDLDIRWHFLGTLQTKKVKKIVHDIDVLHSLDRLKLAKEIDKRRTTPLTCYVQVNISGEPQKHGVDPKDVPDFLDKVCIMDNIDVVGLMGMAELTDDNERIRAQFSQLRLLRDEAVKKHPSVRGLSMGMSEDYEIALEEGASVLRLGRILITEAFYEKRRQEKRV